MNRAGALLMALVIMVPVAVFSKDITLIKHARKQAETLPRREARYTVRPGDTLRKIFLKDFSARPEDLPALFRQFRQINPQVKDLDHLMCNRRIAIPEIRNKVGKTRIKAPDPDAADVYVIKRGEYLAKVLRRMYGLSDDQIFHEYIHLIKELNPHIKDLDLIGVGQKIRLPEIKPAALAGEKGQIPARTHGDTAGSKAGKAAARKTDGKETRNTPAARPETPRQSGSRAAKTAVTDALNPPLSEPLKESAASRLVKKTVLPALSETGAFRRAQGTYFIPLGTGEGIAIDTEKIPVVELENGKRILLDMDDRISPEDRALIEKTYPSVKVVSGSYGELETLMERILNACGYFSVNKDAAPIIVGKEERVRFHGKWVIYKDLSRRKVFVVNLLADEDARSPEEIRRYAAKFGIDLVEMGGRQFPVRKPAAEAFPALDHSYEKLFLLLGLTCEEQKEVVLVSEDTLKIVYIAPLMVGNVVLTEDMPDNTMLSLLRKRGYEVVHTQSKSLEDVMHALGLKQQGPPVGIVIATNRTELDLPAFKVDETIILEHPVDRDIERFLLSTDLKIVVW